MLKHHYLSGLLLALVAVIPWVRPSVGMIITAADINCEIQAENVRGVVQLRGIARGNSVISGTYQFGVTTEGHSGSSDINQGGAFSVGPGQENILGEINIDLEGNASYVAVLTLKWSGGSTSCKKQSSLKI